ncbi:hypothetical protein AtDm6_3453 [Acetobacter tropicalis]|uniref:Uncharacterized protein n=1 Tax=Acetobacter tropicalis TaxID=104102 RepID=A0A094YFQ2_9PROT|nr:hypothetical protein AtDm6_3453 [Acetobacter tropicalis]
MKKTGILFFRSRFFYLLKEYDLTLLTKFSNSALVCKTWWLPRQA